MALLDLDPIPGTVCCLISIAFAAYLVIFKIPIDYKMKERLCKIVRNCCLIHSVNRIPPGGAGDMPAAGQLAARITVDWCVASRSLWSVDQQLYNGSPNCVRLTMTWGLPSALKGGDEVKACLIIRDVIWVQLCKS